jgi:deoxycytidylate deaminase
VKFLKVAHEVALSSSDESFRVGAVLVRGGNILRTGVNQGTKTHPLKARMYPQKAYKGLHAEVHLLRGLRAYDVRGACVYVARTRSNGKAGLARPCEKCRQHLRSMGISKVVYSTETGYGVEKLGKE